MVQKFVFQEIQNVIFAVLIKFANHIKNLQLKIPVKLRKKQLGP